MLNQDPASTISIAGDFTNNYTTLLNTTSATFTFNGTATQLISSASTAGTSTFGHLIIDKASGTVSATSYLEVAGNTTITKWHV